MRGFLQDKVTEDS